jgi:hypothetical protein
MLDVDPFLSVAQNGFLTYLAQLQEARVYWDLLFRVHNIYLEL